MTLGEAGLARARTGPVVVLSLPAFIDAGASRTRLWHARRASIATAAPAANDNPGPVSNRSHIGQRSWSSCRSKRGAAMRPSAPDAPLAPDQVLQCRRGRRSDDSCSDRRKIVDRTRLSGVLAA